MMDNERNSCCCKTLFMTRFAFDSIGGHFFSLLFQNEIPKLLSNDRNAL